MLLTTPPSARRAAPLVADDNGLATKVDQSENLGGIEISIYFAGE
ncbi:MAG: hypothetical protein JWP78_1813 [Mucilaginibacter sp.]|nr:hypothetical protein [Mucilaginibacter sp.]